MAPSGQRRFLPLVLIVASLLLGGCVYIRLLQLRIQLGDFDKNFTVDARDGLTLTFKNPILLDEDMERFFKWVPDSRERSGVGEKWHFAWVKKPPVEDVVQEPLEVGLDVFFTEHKVVTISAPERFFAVSMPKSLALGALMSLGHSKVNQEKRQADGTIDSQVLQSAAADRFLSRSGLLAALGRPTSVTLDKGCEEWNYDFLPVSKRQRFGDSGTVYIHFTLDSDTGKVRIMKGRTMFGGIVFDTTKVGPGATASLNAGLPQ
jgi:hypothetical protein